MGLCGYFLRFQKSHRLTGEKWIYIYVYMYMNLTQCVISVDEVLYVIVLYVIHQMEMTYCNTLQHTATHCNTLQHTATHLVDDIQYDDIQHLIHKW